MRKHSYQKVSPPLASPSSGLLEKPQSPGARSIKHLLLRQIAMLGLVLFGLTGLMAQSTNFESFTLGTVHYKGTGTTVNTGPPGNYTIPSPYGSLWTLADEWGFQKTGSPFDQEVKDDSGNKVWRLSNAVTSGSFSFQACTPSTAQPAGETTAALYNDRGTNHTTPLSPPNARATASSQYFHAGFKFKSATGAAQTGLVLSVSPTPRQSSVRMTFVGLVDNGSTGLNLTFAETLVGGTFSSTETIASNLSYTDWHRVDIYIQFVDGLNGDGTGNDIVTIMLDGDVIKTGTTWETFYASPSWTATPDPIAVDALMFRAGGTAVPGTAGNGLYFDNVQYDNEPLPKVKVYADAAETIYVNGYSTIQTAVSDASTLNGHYVRVAAGTYNEQISVSKQLTFRGPNAGNSAQGSTNRASRVAEAVLKNFIFNAACTLDGFSFEGSNSYNGEVAQLQIFVPNCTVKNTIFNGKIDSPFQVSGQNSLGILLGYNTNTGGLMVDGCYFVRFRTGVFANPCDPSATLTFQNSEFSSRTGINFDLGWTKILANISNNLFQVSTADGNPYGPVTALNFGEVTANSVLSIDGNTWEATFVGIDFKAIKTGTTSVSVTNNTFKNYGMVPSTGIFIVAESGTGASISNNFFTCTKGIQNKAGSVSAGNSITNNSFIVAGATAIENLGTGTLPAECNWFNAMLSSAIMAQIIGSVDFSPFLLDGTDSAPATVGFQPADPCSGPETVPPTAVCQNATVVLDENGNATLAASLVNNGSSDNLTLPANLVFAVSPNTFVCADEGDQSVTLTVTDEEGNTADCMATVTVLDVLYYSETPGLRTAIGGLAQDKMGWGLDLDGGVAIGGAPDDKVGTQNKQGSAFVFLQNQGGSNNWGALKQIRASDGLAVDYFGNAVSIDGSTAVVGAYGDNIGALTDAGSAYIYEKDLGGTNNWGQRKRISASDAAAYAYFGNAISLVGGRAIVGANKHKEGPAIARGAVYIFEKDQGGANNWGQTQKLLASDGAANNFFGASVGQVGNIALVGADGNLNNRGAVYVFDGGASWAQTQKLTASDAAIGDGFGASLSVSGNYAVIGAPNKATYTGAAYVFKNNAGTWSELKKLTASDGATNDRFGTAVDLEGDYAYISALRANGTAGAVYVFHRNAGGPDNWGQIGKYFAAAGAANDQFGYSVAASGDMLAVGANLCDLTGPTRVDAGAVYFFTGEDCPDVPKAPQATFAESRGLAETLSVKCSPNPFRDELAIEINATGAARLTVTDAAGRMMTNLELPAGLGRFTLETSAFRDGMYFVQVSSESGVRVLPVALVR